ncbi:MAG TPA: shikimate dehydrogenase [Dehalococcoidia bacterium]|nr:shikimate dehydrogenase [Dehalococcoidia bacterium]
MLAAIIGYPLGHSMSPAIHNAAYRAMALDLSFEAWSTPPEDVPAAVARVREAGLLGMNVTVPHKQAVMALLDAVDPTAAAIGAVNTIVKQDGRLVGYNTDRFGFIRSLRAAGCEPSGMHTVILGYGGSERAVAYGLAEAGAASISIGGRRPSGIGEAVDHLEATTPRPLPIGALFDDASLATACAQAQLVVNCTPVGMRHTISEGTSPLPARLLRPGLWVCDLIYNPLETELLRLAREAEAHVVNGLDMLVYQAAEAIRLWTGSEAPVDIMKQAALDQLAVRSV